jgi:hypothetical protein
VYAINSSVANPVFTDMARCPVDSGIVLVGYEGDSGIVVKVNGSNYLTSWRKSLSKSGEYARFLCVAATQDHRSPSTVSNVIYVGGHKGEDIPIVAAYYDRAGPSFGLLWQRQLNGLTGIVERIAVDPQDNSVYALVTDQTVGADTWYYVVKLDHLGNQIWCTGVKKTATTGLAVEMAVDYDNIRLLVFDTVFSIKKTDGVLSGEWARSIYIRTITSSPQSAYTSILPVDVTVCQDGHLAVLYTAMHPTTGQLCGIITKLKNGLPRTAMAIDNFNPQTITELKNGQLCVCGYSSQLGKSITCTLPMASTTASFNTALSWGVSTVTTLSAVRSSYGSSGVMGIYPTVTAVNLGYTDAEIYTVSTTGASINTTKTFLDQF